MSVKLIDGSVQLFPRSNQEATDKCKKEGKHRLRYQDFKGREFMLCPNCFYTEDVD